MFGPAENSGALPDISYIIYSLNLKQVKKLECIHVPIISNWTGWGSSGRGRAWPGRIPTKYSFQNLESAQVRSTDKHSAAEPQPKCLK